ncbi:MAG TPA: peptide MFS transporter [Kofleriaceae bacterium]|jgi:POT family proton-dependent oligopeptide transporter|nr:peptide MFS transporter [Kofleriaceae bacterium]
MTSVSKDTAADVARRDRAFLGHPIGLAYLSFAEAWERFSYYGMLGLLTLYLTTQLLLPGHVEHVWGMSGLRGGFESMRGPLSITAFATQLSGLYGGLVYLTPIIGGLVADRALGRKLTVTIGAVVMAFGHFLMAFEMPFLLALLCLLIGVGFFKGNIASQVGALYKSGDTRITSAFQIYYVGINAAVIIAPLVCGTLGETVGWHWGFGVAGVGMLIGLAVYLAGSVHLPGDPLLERRQGRGGGAAPRLRKGEGKRLVLLVLLLPVLALGVTGNQQIYVTYPAWVDHSADLVVFGREMPRTWLLSIDAFASTGFLVGSVVFWRWWSKTRKEPSEITKTGLGYLVSIAGVSSLAIGSYVAESSGTKVSLGFLLAFHVLNSIGFANAFPAALALYARLSPPALAATMMGVFYLHFFAASSLAGFLGGYLEKMPASQFWGLHAAMFGFAGIAVLVVRQWFGHLLQARDEAPS